MCAAEEARLASSTRQSVPQKRPRQASVVMPLLPVTLFSGEALPKRFGASFPVISWLLGKGKNRCVRGAALAAAVRGAASAVRGRRGASTEWRGEGCGVEIKFVEERSSPGN